MSEGDAAPRARRRVRARKLRSALLVALFIDLGYVLALYPRSVASRVVEVEALPTRDLLVLGAGVSPSGAPSRVLEDRLALAKRLYEAGKARTIYLSGDASARSLDETGTMRRWLEAGGVPSARIVEDGEGVRTHVSMVRAKRTLGLEEITVVTSDFHLARSLRLARAVGLDALGVSASTRNRSLATRARFWAREIVSRHRALFDELRARGSATAA